MKRIVLLTAGVVTVSLGWTVLAAQQPGREGGQGREGAPAGEGGRGARGARGRGNQAPADVPGNLFNSKRRATMPTERHEWADIPSGSAKIHTWISYPPGEDKAGVVIVMHPEAGLDDWTRAAADQVAHDGFIAVAPDLLSGHGPGGGGTDAFQFPDEAIRATAKLTTAESLRAHKAAREYGLKLARANGKSASIGFSASATTSLQFAAEVPMLNAAVVFYGPAPADSVLARINAPVLGLYGDLDTLVTPTTAQATADTMKRLGKTFEMQVYPHAGNFFLLYQDMAQNGATSNMAWPKAMAFLKQYLQ